MYQPNPEQFNRDAVIKLNYTSANSYINTMIPDELSLPVPEFHIDVFSRMCHGGAYQCYALPRGTAKSTLAQLTVPWHLVYTEHRYCLYVSAVHKNATNYVEHIIETMESENFVALYGTIDFEGSKGYRRVSEGDYSFLLTKIYWETAFDPMTNTTVVVQKTRRVRCYIQCKGANQGVRGLKKGSQRPSLLLLDDIEDKELLTTGNAQGNYEKLSNWVESTLIKALDKTNLRIIQIGNLVAPTSVLVDNLEDERFETMVYGIIKSDGTLLWPELWSWKDIQADYNAYLKKNKIALWYAEMMNFPRPPGGGIISVNEVTFKQPIEADSSVNHYGCITVDLAATNEVHSHATSIVVHVFDGRHWVNIDGVTRVGLDPLQTLDEIVRLCRKWRINYVGLEAVAFQHVLGDLYDYILAMRNVNFINFVKCPARAAKGQRIAAYASLLRDGVVALASHRNKTVRQLLRYDPSSSTNDDDEVDAAAHIVHMLKNYRLDIEKGFSYNDAVTSSLGVETPFTPTGVRL